MWEILKHHRDPLDDPCKAMFCDPTMSQDLADLEYDKVEKRNFEENFDRPEFTGCFYKPRLNRFNKQVYDRDTKKPMFDTCKHEKGRPKEDFLSEHNLDHNSILDEWLEDLLPHSLVAKWTTYTNIKAAHQHTGK